MSDIDQLTGLIADAERILVFTGAGISTASGIPDYSADIHSLMSDKRMRKILGALSDLPAPQEYSSGRRLRVGVIGWGSTFGSVLEAVKIGWENLNQGVHPLPVGHDSSDWRQAIDLVARDDLAVGVLYRREGGG